MRIRNIQKLCFNIFYGNWVFPITKSNFYSLYLWNQLCRIWHFKIWIKEIEFAANSNFLIPYILATWWWKPLVFHTVSNRIHSLKYLRYKKFGCKYIDIKKSDFATKTQLQRLKMCKFEIPKVYTIRLHR